MTSTHTEEAPAPIATEILTLNVGPQHPSTHGVLRVLAKLDGEIIRHAEPHIGYLHSSCEKIVENRTYPQCVPLLDRFDYLSALFYELAFVRAVEELMEIEVPERARYLRTITCELNRIASHLVFVATFALDLGATTVFLYCFRDREIILDILEELTGARLTYNYFRIGGCAADVPPGFLDECLRFVEYLPDRLQEIDRILTGNRIFLARTRDIGRIAAADAINWGCSGPMLRGSGVPFDLRKAAAYEAYAAMDFDVCTRDEGDVLARYLVRLDEIGESLKIIEQGVNALPDGEIRAKVPRRIRPPEGQTYARVESPRGELGMLVASDGSDSPYRVKVRAPSFCNLATLPALAKDHLVADLVAIIGSIDIVLGDVDR
ncbi:MAG: NADH-quinone oxidoreductase subunit D [Armatimonadota bacterium]|jgi:NADH-quinone oxidoreductase subunit D